MCQLEQGSAVPKGPQPDRLRSTSPQSEMSAQEPSKDLLFSEVQSRLAPAGISAEPEPEPEYDGRGGRRRQRLRWRRRHFSNCPTPPPHLETYPRPKSEITRRKKQTHTDTLCVVSFLLLMSMLWEPVAARSAPHLNSNNKQSAPAPGRGAAEKESAGEKVAALRLSEGPRWLRSTQPCHALLPVGWDSSNVASNVARRRNVARDVSAEVEPETKFLLSPIVAQGRLISRSNVYNQLYFASFRVHKVMKGRLPRKLRRHGVRLMYRMESASSASAPPPKRRRGGRSSSGRQRKSPGSVSVSGPGSCPVSFNVRSGRKYVLFIRKLGPARYVAVARPEVWGKPAKRVARKMLCKGCVSAARVTSLSPSSSAKSKKVSSVSSEEGGNVKLKCKVKGQPAPKIQWMKNGYEITHNFRSRIKTRKRRSTIRIVNLRQTDSGNYSCRAINALGEDSQFISINVRYSAPDPSVSQCPIDSFCLNGGSCLYYEFIGELVCRCRDGFAGQRCQFKKAQIDLPFTENEACGPYGHDIHFREICAAWKQPPVTEEFTREEFDSWKRVERQLKELREQKERQEIERFRGLAGVNVASRERLRESPGRNVPHQLPKLEALALTAAGGEEETS